MNTSLYGGLIEISPDGQPITPDLVLSYRGGTKQGIIHNVQSLTNANALVETAEISFDVYKEIDGVECQLWDDIRDFRLVYIPHLDTSTFNPWYELSVEVDENDCTIKHCQGVHLQEAELGQLTLNGVEINTEDDIARDDYSPTIIYDPKNPEASALDRILKDKASHYTVVHVDSSIANLQRTFSWDGSSIKDAFDDIASEVECLFVYGESVNNDGKIHRTISVYDLNDRCIECGERGSFTTKICPKCSSKNIIYGYGTDSGIFLNHENFAGDITYSSNKDSVKNCFRLVAGDDLMTATVRNINPSGSQYIWYLSDSVRADMSQVLQDKLKAYDTEYKLYSNEKQIDIPSSVISEYNTLINKYKLYDDTLANVEYPITGYSSLTDLYYAALNLYSLLKTTLAPASEHGTKTTAVKELEKLSSSALSPLGIQNADIASSSTVTSAVQNYAKVFIDTSLYRISAKCNIYEAKVWKGTITLIGYADEEDTATSEELTVYVSDVTSDFIKCQIEKAMKKNEVDATGTVSLFKKNEEEFKQALSYYSVDNLNILASVARGCLDILIQQGIADPQNDLYASMYLPYYNRSVWIQDELREREVEVLKLRGTKSNPYGVLDYIERQRQSIANNLDLRSYLGDTLWAEFCSFRRDDTYQNDNFISDGLSDSELIAHAKEFLKSAEREIVKSATLQHTISCNLNNFLLISDQDVERSPIPIVTIDGIHITTHNGLYFVKENSELSPLLVNFDIGNWIHIEIDNTIFKLRLTSYKIDYDNLDKLDVEFSDVTYGLGYMSDTQSILSQAQSMATSYSTVRHQANKGNNANSQIVDMVENGLSLTNKKIVNAAENQNMVVDESGLLMREKNEFGDDYSSEQTKIINHGFYYTNDNWKTVQTGLGKYVYYDPESGTYKEDYGIIAHKIIGNIILGNEVGIYNTAGSLKMDEHGVTITADAKNPNKELFTLQRKNEDGSYTKYVYVDDEGNIKINGKHIQMTTGDDLDSYIESMIEQGNSSITLHLSNEYSLLPTNTDGSLIDFSECYTDVSVFSGDTDITASQDLKWIVTTSSDIEGEWDNNSHRYKVNNMLSDNGEVTFDIIYKDKVNITKNFRICKIISDTPGRSYILSTDCQVIKVDGNNIVSPNAIKIKGYYKDLNGEKMEYPCRFVVSKTYEDASKSNLYLSQYDSTEFTISISGEVQMPLWYTIEIHTAGQEPTDDNLLDIQTIPVLVNKSDILIGARNFLKQSNSFDGCHYYGTSESYNIFEDMIDTTTVTKIQTSSSYQDKAIFYKMYTAHLNTYHAGSKLTVSMNVFSNVAQTIYVCLANENGTMRTTDVQPIHLSAGWNKTYTILTLMEVNREIVTDNQQSFVTDLSQLITTGDVGVNSNVLRITDDMTDDMFYAIAYIQLESGNRPTDYRPAPEDVRDYTDNVAGNVSNELKEIISGVMNDVTKNRQDFDDLIGEDGVIETIRKSNVITQQQVDRMETNVNTYIVQVDTINGKVLDIEKTTQCFSMEDAGLRITRKSSKQSSDKQLSMLLSEQKLSFYQGTDEVAYFSNNKLYVKDAEILDSLQLGKFAFIPRSNGNLSFRYTGTK